MSNTATTDGGTVLTIPANSRWLGSISLSATYTTQINTASSTRRPSITVSGAGGNWDDGNTVLAMDLTNPPVLATSASGGSTHGDAVTPQVVVQARANPVSLILNLGGTGVTAIAVACGELL